MYGKANGNGEKGGDRMNAKDTARILEWFEAKGYSDEEAKELLKYIAYGDPELLKPKTDEE